MAVLLCASNAASNLGVGFSSFRLTNTPGQKWNHSTSVVGEPILKVEMCLYILALALLFSMLKRANVKSVRFSVMILWLKRVHVIKGDGRLWRERETEMVAGGWTLLFYSSLDFRHCVCCLCSDCDCHHPFLWLSLPHCSSFWTCEYRTDMTMHVLLFYALDWVKWPLSFQASPHPSITTGLQLSFKLIISEVGPHVMFVS